MSNDIVILVDGSDAMNKNRFQKVKDSLVAALNQNILAVNQVKFFFKYRDVKNKTFANFLSFLKKILFKFFKYYHFKRLK